MNSIRCPELDRLGRELIEAYRQVGDADVFCLSYDLNGSDAVFNVHHKMAEHRRSCFLCQQAEHHAFNPTFNPKRNSAVLH